LNERNVSRHHARILRENGGIIAEDLDSYNGVYINGDRVKQRQDLHEGDILRVGDFQLELRGEGMTRRTEETTQKAGPPEEQETTKPSIRLDDSAPDDGAFRDPAEYDDQEEDRGEPTAIIRVGQMEELDSGAGKHSIAGAKARLVCVSTQFAGEEFEIDREESVIGRTEDNDIAVDHRSVSRHHAKIMVSGRSFRIIDMKSANGTLVNGEEYAQIELKSGDLIELGHVKFRFVPPGGSYTPNAEEAAAMARGENPAKRATVSAGAAPLADPAPVSEYIPPRDPTNPHARVYVAQEPRRSSAGLYIGIGLVVVLLAAVLAVLLMRQYIERPAAKLVEVAPSNTENPEDERVRSLLDRMTDAVVDENWASAKELAGTVLLLDSDNTQAEKVLKRSNMEIESKDALDKAQGELDSLELDAALEALEDVSTESSVALDAERMRVKVKHLMGRADSTAAIRKAIDAQDYEAADRLAQGLLEVDKDAATDFIQEIKTLRAKKPRTPRPRPAVKPSAPAPAAVKEPPAPVDEGKKPADFLKEAVTLINGNQPEKALKPLQECVRANARYCRCYRALGIAHARMKNNAKAARNYR
ncbi:MAG: FHA domain-containing protein, partial [Myxococcota bacterium]